ncbi:hypothetical protein KVR01_005407 [Diaporthe batatas]|uniref:uncharacterized protein n=1 Tax=Diaporthe batatas TaxID=748121 RepID=UPI001D042223|nr:uncharacterized protein KVR01_005407 [Diaporthe batatas]KAG8165132.1 hypothetical protein KVR01_005407 [Diaporthe batatas]
MSADKMAEPAPDLHLKPSSAIVGVRIINTTSWISLPTKLFFGPHIKGFDQLSVPSYSFLIEHPSGRKLLFDLGVRKDWENLSPVTLGMIEQIRPAKIDAKKGVREQLEEHGVSGSSIEGIIWSHWHFDHTGDPSTFDAHTALIVGPGFKDALTPGYPANQDSVILESDYSGRELREIQFKPGNRIGRFEAFDYFGDGSYYILNAPGHTIGHICSLARVTSNQHYILMGADTAHQAGQFRPSIYLPLPDRILPHPLDIRSATPCPGALFEHLLRNGDKSPFFDIAKDGVAFDADEAQESIGKLQEADAHSNILVVLAHDKSLLPWATFFPEYANDFISKNWAGNGRWAFLKDLEEALE